MLDRFSGSMITIAMAAAAAGTVILTPIAATQAQSPAASAAAPALQTPWGEPDLQGIWMEETDTPLERPARFADKEFFTEAEREDLDTQRTAIEGKDVRAQRGTEEDVGGSYNQLFVPRKHTGARTSLISDPPNGRIPQLTPEARKLAADERAFRLSLLQSTESCKNHLRTCAGGKYDPAPSPRFAELPPRYNTLGMNRHDGPEDVGLAVRCLPGELPEFASISFRRIVQTPGGIAMFEDVGQGQGYQRNIVMNGSAHLPSSIRQWFGDSRGHWEGNTLVVDVTNFTAKTDFRGSRENLHLIERWTRVSPTELDYDLTIEDPTVWMRSWTVKRQFTKQSNEENRIYYEPRCVEGNFALPGLLHGSRIEETEFAAGKGPNPITRDTTIGNSGVGDDPLEIPR